MSLSFRIVFWQVVATVVAAGIFWLAGGADQGMAALLGGMTAVGPAALFAWRASNERSAQKLLVAGVVKFVSTCVLLALCVVLFMPSPAGFFTAFAVVQVMYVAVPALRPEGRLPGG